MLIAHHKETGVKHCRSTEYNYTFDPRNGDFVRWGKTLEDNPVCGPVEIADIEISEVCHGIPKPGTNIPVVCSFCYKTNSPIGHNMTFDTFKTILDKLPETLTQWAAGIGDIDSNPDMIQMFEYSREQGIIPNLTINGWGLTDDWASTLAKYCGGIAVSAYDNKDVCYDAVKKLTNAGIAQVNIHKVLAHESVGDCYKIIDDIKNDPRLAKLKALVFLTLKPKGKRNQWTTIKDVNIYKKLIEYAFDRGVGIGFDSCSAKTFLKAMKDHPRFDDFAQLSESCESTLFSLYINAHGDFYPCSFTEGEQGWETGISVVDAEDFNRDVWHHPRTEQFRSANIATTDTTVCNDCRSCVTFPELHDYVAINKTSKVIIPIIKHVEPKSLHNQLYGR